MSDDAKYQISFSGQFADSQFVVGDHNTVSQHLGAAARERLAPAELEHLITELAAIRELVATRVPEPDRDQALGQVHELRSEALETDEPRPARLARVYRWFLENVPDLAESLSSLLLGPLVGKLVGGGAGAVAAALGGGDRLGESHGEAPGEARR
jgi:hypothetical protein